MSNQNYNKQALIDEAKAKMLGADPFGVAYEALYGLVAMAYRETGAINHEIIGFNFKDGAIEKVNVLLVEEEHLTQIHRIIESLLQQFPVVAQIMEAWASPPSLYEPSQHPERQEVISIHIHTDEAYSVASCPINPNTRTVEKTPLFPVIRTAGKMAYKIQTRH